MVADLLTERTMLDLVQEILEMSSQDPNGENVNERKDVIQELVNAFQTLEVQNGSECDDHENQAAVKCLAIVSITLQNTAQVQTSTPISDRVDAE